MGDDVWSELVQDVGLKAFPVFSCGQPTGIHLLIDQAHHSISIECLIGRWIKAWSAPQEKWQDRSWNSSSGSHEIDRPSSLSLSLIINCNWLWKGKEGRRLPAVNRIPVERVLPSISLCKEKLERVSVLNPIVLARWIKIKEKIWWRPAQD